MCLLKGWEDKIQKLPSNISIIKNLLVGFLENSQHYSLRMLNLIHTLLTHRPSLNDEISKFILYNLFRLHLYKIKNMLYIKVHQEEAFY
jgi:hypothetical protein